MSQYEINALQHAVKRLERQVETLEHERERLELKLKESDQAIDKLRDILLRHGLE